MSEQHRRSVCRRLTKDLYDELDHVNYKDLNQSILHIIGSKGTGLISAKSDTDFVVELLEDGVVTALLELREHLKKSNRKFKVILSLTQTRVPLLTVMHRKTQTPVDITFMCPSIRRDGAIKNTRLLRSYAENDTKLREAFNFVKFLLGHKPIFSARTQGFSSYTWAILMIQYVIKIRRIYIDPSDYEVYILENQKLGAAGLVVGFLNFVLEDLPYHDVDVLEIRPRVKRKAARKPKIRDPYERERYLDQYLNEHTWSTVLQCAKNTRDALSTEPHLEVERVKNERSTQNK